MMDVRPLVKVRPQPAQSLEAIIDIIAQLFGLIGGIIFIISQFLNLQGQLNP